MKHNREEEEVVQRPEAEEGGLLKERSEGSGLIEERYDEKVMMPSMETQQCEMICDKYGQRSPDVKVKVVPVKGDVYLLKLETKDGRLCRIKKVFKDGLVRIATIVYMAKRKGKVAVQRLVPGGKVAVSEEEEARAEG